MKRQFLFAGWAYAMGICTMLVFGGKNDVRPILNAECDAEFELSPHSTTIVGLSSPECFDAYLVKESPCSTETSTAYCPNCPDFSVSHANYVTTSPCAVICNSEFGGIDIVTQIPAFTSNLTSTSLFGSSNAAMDGLCSNIPTFTFPVTDAAPCGIVLNGVGNCLMLDTSVQPAIFTSGFGKLTGLEVSSAQDVSGQTIQFTDFRIHADFFGGVKPNYQNLVEGACRIIGDSFSASDIQVIRNLSNLHGVYGFFIHETGVDNLGFDRRDLVETPSQSVDVKSEVADPSVTNDE